MDEATGIIVDTLGHLCEVVNCATGETTSCMVKITQRVEIYDNGIFAGTEVQAMFDINEIQPKISDTLKDEEGGKEYTLAGIRTETDSKLVFYISER